jgi:hypothetical protein
MFSEIARIVHESGQAKVIEVVNGRSRTDEMLIDFDPCAGDDCVIECRTVKVVKTRKEHICLGMMGSESMHTIPPGTRARYYVETYMPRSGGDFVWLTCKIRTAGRAKNW